MFQEIKALFEEQNKLICKKFENLEKKIDKKFNGFRDRLTKLERTQKKKGKANSSVKTECQLKCNCSGTDELIKELHNTCVEKLARRIPRPFQNFVKNQFVEKNDINLHFVGTRLYRHAGKGIWTPVRSPKKYLEACLENIWRLYNVNIEDEFEDHVGWKTYSQISKQENNMETDYLKKLILQKTDIAKENRGL